MGWALQHTVEGPDKHWLTAAEAALWLGISMTTFKELVAEEKIPPPVRLTDRAPRWYWLDLVAFSHLESRKSGNNCIVAKHRQESPGVASGRQDEK